MRSSVVVLVVIVCVAVVCESAAISKQQRDGTADDDATKWLHGLVMKTRHINPWTRRLEPTEQKRRREVSKNTAYQQ